LPLFEQILISC